MEPQPPDVRGEAASFIENANLRHPSSSLLFSFINNAMNPKVAASYVVQACRVSDDARAEVKSLLEDWTFIVESVTKSGQRPPIPEASDCTRISRRDGSMDCISGQKGTIRDPLLVLPILPLPARWGTDKPRIFEMLGAFFTPPYRDWWLAYVRSPADTSPLHSHWLVRKSSSQAFARGLVKLDRQQPSFTEYEVHHLPIGTLEAPIHVEGRFALMGDHSRTGISKVDPRFVGTHARLSESIRWLEVAQQISSNKEPRHKASLIKSILDLCQIPVVLKRVRSLLAGVVLATWRVVPARLRVSVYRGLQQVGLCLYGLQDDYAPVQRLPFGLYLKYRGSPEEYRNEFNALKLVRQFTSVPVPRPLDIAVVGGESEDDQQAYLLTTRVPGVQIGHGQDLFSDDDFTEYATQMQHIITQLRAIPRPEGTTETTICNTLAGPCRDRRIDWGNPIGPFGDEASFNQHLRRHPNDPARSGHRIYFTHADLNARNILVDQITRPDGTREWVVSGIVDWENAGYYPEYWDYTKSLFEGFRFGQRWRDATHKIFKAFGDLSREYEIEARSWSEGPE